MRCWNCGKDRVDRIDNVVTLESTFVCGNCGMDQSKRHQESGLSTIKPSPPLIIGKYKEEEKTIEDIAEELVQKVKSRDELIQKQDTLIKLYQKLMEELGVELREFTHSVLGTKHSEEDTLHIGRTFWKDKAPKLYKQIKEQEGEKLPFE